MPPAQVLPGPVPASTTTAAPAPAKGRQSQLAAGLFFLCCLALFAVVGWEPAFLAPDASAKERRLDLHGAVLPPHREELAPVAPTVASLQAPTSSKSLRAGAGAAPGRLEPTRPPALAELAKNIQQPPTTPRRRPPPAAGGITHKGVGTVVGLESNNNVTADPLYDVMVDAPCSLPDAAEYTARVVAEQLAPWAAPSDTAGDSDRRPPIRMRYLDMLFCVRKQVARISYVRGELRHASWQLNMDLNRLRQSMWFLRLATLRAERRGRPLPDFELVLNPTDKTAGFARGGTEDLTDDPLPLFCNAKCAGDSSISFPIMFNAQLGGAAGEMALPLYAAKYEDLERLGQQRPWQEKRTSLFFSGTNLRGNREAIYKSRSPHVTALLEVVPVATYGEYRYLIYAFGHSGWSQRLRELAFMEAVVLVEDSPCREFYHAAFVPGRDYVLLREDLSDLDEKLETVVVDEAGSAAMALRWRTRGQQVLSLPCVLDYVEALLREYAARQDFAPVPQPTWPLFHLNATPTHFMSRQPPQVEVCREFF